MTDLQIHYTTFNCGRSLVHVDYFASSLYTSLSKNAALPPDLLVLALQEIAPIGYSFLGGSFLTPYFSRIADAVYRAAEWSFGKEAQYEHVVTRNVGMTGVMVFAKKSVKEKIRWLEEAGAGVGVWEMGNKGAVGVRLGLEGDAAVTFVAAHLAPMEDACARRNEDWENICRTLVFEPVSLDADNNPSEPGASVERQPLLADSRDGHSGIFDSVSHIFFAGDLNYRTSDTPPDPKEFSTWPQPMSHDSDPSHWSKLLSQDQLTRELHSKKTLHNLSEAPITFAPTYKYSSRAQKLAEETADAHVKASNDSNSAFPGIKLDEIQEQVWLWAKHRVPSWCDRILFLASAPPTVHSYAALTVQPTSDHRPVVLSCSIPWKPLAESRPIKQPFAITKDWKARRTTARRLEIAVGTAAYLGFTGQGETLLGGTVVGLLAGYFLLQYLLAS